MSPLRWWSGLVLVLTVSLLGSLLYIKSAPPRAENKLNFGSEIQKSQRDSPPDYVGWNQCAHCHADRVAEFQQTRHFQAIKLPEQYRTPEGFLPGKNQFEPPDSPVKFEMNSSLGSFHVATSPLSSQDGPTSEAAIEFVYGAGAGTDEVFFSRRGEALFELPVVWLPHQACWGASTFDRHAGGDLSRPLTPQCLECHNTWVPYRRGTLNQYGPFDPQFLGVTCERCHGPAKAHVEHHRAHPDEKLAAHIVEPRELNRDRLMDLCAQCHANSIRYRRAPFSYRAGEVLDDYFRKIEFKYPEQNHVANQVDSLRASRCFQASDKMTCVTCHDPHHARTAEGTTSRVNSCRTCHQDGDCSAHSRIPEQVRDNCVGCHMPKRNKIQVYFATRDDPTIFPAPRYEHRIGVYPDAEWEVLYRLYRQSPAGLPDSADATNEAERLRKQLASHWISVAESVRDQHRFLAEIDAWQHALEFDESPENRQLLERAQANFKRSNSIWSEANYLKQTGKLAEALEQFQALIQLNPDYPKARYELGTILAAKGQIAHAVDNLRLAAEIDPHDPSPWAMLGWLDYLSGNIEQALENYRRADEIEPWNAQLKLMQGECLSRMNRPVEAIDKFLLSMEIDPNRTDAGHALRKILRERFTAADALPQARHAVELTDESQAELLLLLAEIYTDLQRKDEARATLLKAERATNPGDRSIMQQILALKRNFEGKLRTR